MKLTSIPKFFKLPYLPIWLVPAVLFLPMIVSGQALFWGTPFLQFVPWRAAAVEIMKGGHLPVWNPWVGMGAPLLANYQSALLYPPNLLLLGLQVVGGASAQAWGQAIVLLLHLVWAGVGMALWVRDMGLGKTAQSVAGMAFGASTYLVARSGFLSINAAVAWLPWVLLGTNRIAGPRLGEQIQPSVGGWKASLWLALAVGMQLLAGHAQSTWYTLLLASAWVLLWGFRQVGWKSIYKPVVRFALGIALGVGLAAIQLVPTAEYLLQSQRASEVGLDYALNYSFWPWHLLTLIAPDFFGSPARGDYWFNAWYWEDAVYIGLLPFILGVTYAVASLTRRHKVENANGQDDSRTLVAFSLVGTFVSFIFALGRYTPVFPFFYLHVPTFNMFQAPARISLWAVVCLVLLGALGVDRWRTPRGRARLWTRRALAASGAILFGAGAAWIGLHIQRATFIRAFALAGIWSVGIAVISLYRPRDETRAEGRWAWGVVALLACDLVVANWGLQPAIPASYYSTPAGSQAVVEQTAGGHRLYLDQQTEYDLKFINYLLVEDFNPGRDWMGFKDYLLPDANLLDRIPSANNFDPLVPANFSDWMDRIEALNPNQRQPYLAMMDVGAVERLDPYAESGVWYQPVKNASRFAWFGCAITTGDNQQAWEAMERINSAQDYPKSSQPVVILGNTRIGGSDCKSNPVAKITIINENPDGVKLRVSTDQAGWLYQADTWYPGWTAKVDGKTQSIERANINFRAVPVPAGVHEIEIRYQPISFYIGVVITLLTSGVIIGWMIQQSRK